MNLGNRLQEIQFQEIKYQRQDEIRRHPVSVIIILEASLNKELAHDRCQENRQKGQRPQYLHAPDPGTEGRISLTMKGSPAFVNL